jgi:hypothetical protein
VYRDEAGLHPLQIPWVRLEMRILIVSPDRPLTARSTLVRRLALTTLTD